MDNDLAAAAIASGPTEASLTGERLGIFKEVDNLDRHSIFQVVSSGFWNSFGSQDIFREFQKHCRLGTDRPPYYGVVVHIPPLQRFFLLSTFPYKVVNNSLQVKNQSLRRVRDDLDQVSYFA